MLFHVRDKKRRTTTGRDDTLAGSVASLKGLMLLPSLPGQHPSMVDQEKWKPSIYLFGVAHVAHAQPKE